MMGTLTKQEFETLVSIEAGATSEFSKEIIDDLLNKGYICKTDTVYITDEGILALEPYRVKRAVIMAAGFGKRMVPVTLTTPKPLVKVNGKRIIDTIMEAVNNAGIEEVWLVRGYLWEKFDELLTDYPNIKFILNEHYNEANNISSALLAGEYLSNAYVLEADLVINNPSVIRKYEYETNYIGRYCEHTDDWCFKVSDGIIKELLVVGDDVYHMYGISYWTYEDGIKLFDCIKKTYEMENGKEKYWDEVSMRVFKDEFSISVRPCYDNDIIEIDTFEELVELDPSYRNYEA